MQAFGNQGGGATENPPGTRIHVGGTENPGVRVSKQGQKPQGKRVPVKTRHTERATLGITETPHRPFVRDIGTTLAGSLPARALLLLRAQGQGGAWH